MKISTILTASTLLGAFASAAPTSALDTRAFQVGVTFYGTDEGTSFFQTFLANEDPVNINPRLNADELTKLANPLSVSRIAFAGGAVCFFTGVDGSVTVLEYQQIREADVSPPQAQVSGYCIQ